MPGRLPVLPRLPFSAVATLIAISVLDWILAATAALVFVGWSVYRRPDATFPRPDSAKLAEAEALLRQHGGNDFAHLLFLGDKNLHWSPDRQAFIQYGQIRQRLVALGDPCGNPDAFESAILTFRDYADSYGFTPCFYEVGQARMHLFHDAGFRLFKLGESAVVDLLEYTISGKQGDSLRSSVNRARRSGARFELCEQPLDKSLWPQLKAVSDDWLTLATSMATAFTTTGGFAATRRSFTQNGEAFISPIRVMLAFPSCWLILRR